ERQRARVPADHVQHALQHFDDDVVPAVALLVLEREYAERRILLEAQRRAVAVGQPDQGATERTGTDDVAVAKRSSAIYRNPAGRRAELDDAFGGDELGLPIVRARALGERVRRPVHD